MKRTVYCGLIACVAIVTTASVLAQSRTRASSGRQRGQTQARSSWSVDPQTGLDQTPARQHAEHQRRLQQRMAEMQRQAAEMQRRAEESKNNTIRRALNATEEQWRRIQPQLDLIERLKAEADVAIDPGTLVWAPGSTGNTFAFGGGFVGGAAGAFGTTGEPGQNWSQYKSWSWPPAASDATPDEMTDGEAICAQVGDLLRDPASPADELAQKIAALRQIRQSARQRLARTRKNLQTMLTPQQQLPLVALGYLE
jgi:TolA-binding protein